MHQCFCSSSHVFFKIHTGECSFYLLRFLVNMSHILLTQMGLPHFLWSGNFPNSVSMLTFSEVSRFQALHELNTSFLLFSFTYASHQQRACQTKAGPQFSPNKLVAMIPYYHINISACASLLCQQLESIFQVHCQIKEPLTYQKILWKIFATLDNPLCYSVSLTQSKWGHINWMTKRREHLLRKPRFVNGKHSHPRIEWSSHSSPFSEPKWKTTYSTNESILTMNISSKALVGCNTFFMLVLEIRRKS